MKARSSLRWGSLWRYFLATYALAWAAWTPAIILRGAGPSMLFVVLGACAPSIVGIALTSLTEDRRGRCDFWSRVFSLRRIGWRWLLAIALLYPAVHGLAFALALMLGQTQPSLADALATLRDPLPMAQIVVANLIISGLSEELGWRGFALDRMQARWRPLPASLILGLAHGLWHLPLFFVPGITQGEMGLFSWSALAFLVGATAGAVAMTWVYNNTDRSILSAILMHFMANLCIDVLAGLQGALPPGYFVLYAGAFVLVDLAVVATWRTGDLRATPARGGVGLPLASDAAAVGPRQRRGFR